VDGRDKAGHNEKKNHDQVDGKILQMLAAFRPGLDKLAKQASRRLAANPYVASIPRDASLRDAPDQDEVNLAARFDRRLAAPRNLAFVVHLEQ
jgi:hypothetical protein